MEVLSREPVELNRLFMLRLFELDLEGQINSFERLSYATGQRTNDPEMDLERYISSMEEPRVYLTSGKKDSSGRTAISYEARSVTPEDERFAVCSIPYSDENYDVVNGAFRRIFSRDITESADVGRVRRGERAALVMSKKYGDIFVRSLEGSPRVPADHMVAFKIPDNQDVTQGEWYFFRKGGVFVGSLVGQVYNRGIDSTGPPMSTEQAEIVSASLRKQGLEEFYMQSMQIPAGISLKDVLRGSIRP